MKIINKVLEKEISVKDIEEFGTVGRYEDGKKGL